MLLGRAEPYRSLHGNVEQCVRVESIELDVSGQEHEVVILLRDLKRPGCIFGRRAPAVEPGVFEDDLYGFETVKDAAGIYALITWTGLEGSLFATGHSLPEHCSPGAITWF